MSNKSHSNGFSSRSLFLIWAGAAISVAEILSGSVLASLGMSSGLMAILLGHIIGGALLYLAAIMSSSLRASAMESTRYSFGIYGSYVFSGFNILQLVGWTSIMMLQGSRILDQITVSLYGYSNPNLWMIGIALCISIWLLFISRQHAQLNGLVVILLLLLSLVMGYRLIRNLSFNTVEGEWPTITFWQGVELNIAMCLSWLPLIGDYTQHARQMRNGPLWSAIGYSVVGSSMFALGLGLSLATGSSDIALMLTISGLGLASLFIVFFSTVTTTYLDVYSASDSFMNIWPLKHGKLLSMLFTFISLLIALLLPVDAIEPFLYLIGAIFSPLYALLFVDYFILRRPSAQANHWNLTNMILWGLGVVLYFLMQSFLIDVSNSLLIFLIVGGISVLIKGSKSMCKVDYTLYMVTDKTLMRDKSVEECVKQALSGGVTLVQLREKHLDIDDFIKLGKRIKDLCDAHDVPLVINDRLDVALGVEASGLHIGQQDLSASEARARLGPNRLLGVSVTTVAQAKRAQADGADYLGVGAMFVTKTKQDASYVSLQTLTAIRKAVNLPIVTIGGMNKETIPLCAPYGVQGFAVVSALVSSPDVYLAARELKQYSVASIHPV